MSKGSTIAGPAGHYFHAQHEGVTKSKPDPDKNAAAVLYIARHKRDRHDFELLVDVLGLSSTVEALRGQRSA